MKSEKPKTTGLVITRYPGQRITIGGNVVVKLHAIEGDRAYLRIEAPKDVRIERPTKPEDHADRLAGRNNPKRNA